MTIAIIGAGISGICSAKSCLEEGLSPIVYESSSLFGGNWTEGGQADTGVFDNLITNTPFYENTTTDILPLRKGPRKSLGDFNSLFMTAGEWFEYIQHVVNETPRLKDCISMNSFVLKVELKKNKYLLTIQINEKTETRMFDNIIVATGRNQVPFFPDIPGLKNFKGLVMHSQEYKNNNRFVDKKVLIVGGSISGIECAGNLCDQTANAGVKAVTLVTRSMKHFLLKEKNGLAYTSYYANSLTSYLLFSGVHSVSEEQDRIRPFLEKKFSRNTDYGLPTYPRGSISVPASHSFLHAAKNGDILSVKVDEIESALDDGSVKFKSGSKDYFDAIIFATGYTMNFPMFESSVNENLFFANSQSTELKLYKRTWTPALPGCAFVGLFNISGAIMTTIDMQSRWVARAFSDKKFLPTENEMLSELELFSRRRKQEDYIGLEFHVPLMLDFSRMIGCEIDYSKYPELTKFLLCGPFLPIQFRLCGHKSVRNPIEQYKEAAKRAGFDIRNFEVTSKDIELLEKCVQAFKRTDYMPPGFENAVIRLRKERLSHNTLINRIKTICRTLVNRPN